MNNNKFRTLGVNEMLSGTLAEAGFEQPTPIQSQAIPPLLAGSDLLGIAQTGTGKTAAFGLPVIQHLLEAPAARPRCPHALVLAPTRELAAQIQAELARFTAGSPLRLACIFGGVSHRPQVKALQRGIDILVATPGRLLDLANEGDVDLSRVRYLVLDEADRLLDMGFIRDVRRIVNQTPTSRQSLLFSATMPREVAQLAAEILDNPQRVDVSPRQITVSKIDQRVVHVNTDDKQRMLEKLLHDDAVTRAIVFTRTKHGANRVAKKLVRNGINAEAIHGNKSQGARERALASFKGGDCWVLVATDIAARGIDISGISHVINFELPHEPESYVHRIGRTARAGAAGVAWALVDASEQKRLRAVEKLTRDRLKEMHIELPPRTAEERAGDERAQDDRARHERAAPTGQNRGRSQGRAQSHGARNGNGSRSSGGSRSDDSASSAGNGSGGGRRRSRRRRNRQAA